MFRLRTPTAEQWSHLLARERNAPLTYDEVGATFDEVLPDGYHHVRESVALGRGEPTWDRAREGIRTWAAHRGAGLTVVPEEAPIEEGTTVATVAAVGPLRVVLACRIVRVVDEPSRYGFAYGTLPSHPEEGEERFVVTRAGDGTVDFEVVAFSRAHDLLTRLGGPIPRAIQSRTTQRYLDGMRRHVG